MNLKKTFLSLLILAVSAPIFAQDIEIIPKPRTMEVGSSEFNLDRSTKILYNRNLKEQALLIQELLINSTTYELSVSSGSKEAKNSIYITLDNKIQSDEAYTLDVTKDGVVIKGKDKSGIYYGIQSLLQLFPAEVYSDKAQRGTQWSIPTVHIEDEPQLKWRGMMLDVSRYFMSKNYVLHYIDMMAMYKLNTLHLHLVDDAGWRIESKIYPKLTTIGGFRGEGENRTGGFYTQEDMKEMIAYAELRGITIIPELEFPAHILSAVVAYPWLSCKGEQLTMPEQHYISKDLLCIGKETTIKFLEDIIDETCELFPSKYIHIGGDEAVYTYWETCPHCQKLKEEQGIEKSSEIQAYLTNIVAKMAAKHNRTIVGWDEILQRGPVTEPVVSMIWRNINNADEALELGHKAVFTLSTHHYFDFPESNFPSEVKAATWMPHITVEKCYSLDMSKYENNENVLGMQGSLWTDQFIHGTILQEIAILDENRSENYVDYLTLPRLLALSESAWTAQKDKDYTDFESRLARHFKRLDYAGFNYRVPTPEIVSTEKVADGYIVELNTIIEGATIHFTTDGSRPTPYDPQYTEKVKVTQLSDLRAVTAINKEKHSVPLYFSEDFSKYKEYGRFAKTISYNTLKSGDNKVVVDLTGKVSGNGKYEITMIPLTDRLSVELGGISILKRDEVSATAQYNQTLTADPATVEVTIGEWQAGTPYSAEIEVKCGESNQGNFAIFIKGGNRRPER